MIPRDLVRRLLIVRLTSLGDVVNALPALSALRQMLPTAHLAWAVEPPLDQLLRGHPMLDAVIAVPRKRWRQQLRSPRQWPAVWREVRELRDRLRERPFDVALDLQGNLRSALVTALSGARYRVGFGRREARELSHLVCNLHVRLARPGIHRVTRGLKLLACLGEVPPEPEPFVPIAPDDHRFAEGFFRAHRYDAELVAVLHPGVSRFGSYKQWPEARYAELADLLAQACGVRSLLTWGPGERPVCERIAQAARCGPLVAPETRSIRQLAALIRRADLFIGSDSGPARLAWAVGTPQVALFGPKDPAIYGPHTGRFVVVERDLPCRPCRKRTCDDPQCMAAITAQDVLRAAQTLLEG